MHSRFNNSKSTELEDFALKNLISQRYGLPVDAVCLEMLDYFKIVAMGARKYAMNNWLEPDGKRSSEKEMHDSMFHHLAESYSKAHDWALSYPLDIRDTESGKDPLLHLACRALMVYTRRQRQIVHPDDKNE